MELTQVISERRAYRSLDPVQITENLLNDLAESAQLAPSCFNNQPWRYVFVYSSEMLQLLQSAIPDANKWVQAASMLIAVISKPTADCQIKGREYYLFDTGMASAFMILRATELGLVAHPIAGFNEEQAKNILEIPAAMTLITLIIVGKHSETIGPLLSEKQRLSENKRPNRFALDQFIHFNKYSDK